MRIRCLKCQIVKELTKEELLESGEFVEKRKLRAVGFLKVLSLDLREDSLCTNGKNHEWEFEESFDKEIHELAANVKNTKSIVVASKAEEVECDRIIAEMGAKREAAIKRAAENGTKVEELLGNMKEIAFIPDETLWS